MTNSDLETLFKEMSGLSTVAALRYIYDLGYFDGAGVTTTALHGEQSKAQPICSATNRTNMQNWLKKIGF
jgi:hypothetical protein